MRSVRICLFAVITVLLSAGAAGAQEGRAALVKAFRNLQAGSWSILDIDAVRRYARAGDRQAVEVWAWMNATGTAVPPNPLEAFRWYIHAAELGAPRALQNARIVWAVILPHRRPQLSPELEQRLLTSKRLEEQLRQNVAAWARGGGRGRGKSFDLPRKT